MKAHCFTSGSGKEVSFPQAWCQCLSLSCIYQKWPLGVSLKRRTCVPHKYLKDNLLQHSAPGVLDIKHTLISLLAFAL